MDLDVFGIIKAVRVEALGAGCEMLLYSTLHLTFRRESDYFRYSLY